MLSIIFRKCNPGGNFILSLFGILLLYPFNTSAQTATEMIEFADQKMRGNSSQAELVIKTIRPSWYREMSVRTWMKGNDLAMIQILSPVKEKGIVFLKRKKEVWNWLPALERSIKLPPSMMSQSWMGTDFTNDDLVKESSIVNDYGHSFLKDTMVSGSLCYKILCIPKPGTAVVWGKLIVCIEKENMVERYTEFYDEESELINLMYASELKMMDGRLIPTRIQMIPMDKKGHKTEIMYRSVAFDKVIRDDFFSIEQMKRLQ
jgi:outer membrane lipoprotein-sorting protein